MPLETVERSVRNSLCFGFYQLAEQAGFARVTTDYTTVADVFVPEHRGRSVGPWLMEILISHPELEGLRRWMLATADAYGPDCR